MTRTNSKCTLRSVYGFKNQVFTLYLSSQSSHSLILKLCMVTKLYNIVQTYPYAFRSAPVNSLIMKICSTPSHTTPYVSNPHVWNLKMASITVGNSTVVHCTIAGVMRTNNINLCYIYYNSMNTHYYYILTALLATCTWEVRSRQSV